MKRKSCRKISQLSAVNYQLEETEHQDAWVRIPPTPIDHLKLSQSILIYFFCCNLSYLPEETITLILNNFHEASQENDPIAFV